MTQADEERSLLLPERAFVVQFRDETRLDESHMIGRVEHVVSGRATLFSSLDELVAFIEGTLSDSAWNLAARKPQ